jgi:tetratricopeptide (TPR) repeat protein
MAPTSTRRFDVALSFPGEQRQFVEQVAAHLASTFGERRVLYDQYHDAELARLDLDVYLPHLYREQAELILVFLCAEYAQKHWCRLEWRHVRQLISTADAGRIMLVSFGNPGDLTELGILPGDGYLDIGTRSAEAIAEKIRERLRVNQGITAPAVGATPATPCDISRIDRYAPEQLVGREAELGWLSDAWAKVRRDELPRPHIITLVALGGEGKTSLVAKWAAGLAAEDWPGCEAAFAWSFYSQGTRDQMTASSDLFLKEALTFFGDPGMAGSAQGAFDKGKRLGRLVGERKALLVVDGLEPLQYAPTSPQPGELKDQGIRGLLKGLAAQSRGLCVVTTRHSVADLKAYRQGAAPELQLSRLSPEAGVELLRSLGVHGSRRDFETLVEDVKGHALTLNLLGAYLHEAHGGDIRRRDLVRLEHANAEEQGGHAFHVMDAYVRWLAPNDAKPESQQKGKQAVAVLQLLGLFDRPATANCLAALKQAPAIPGLTEALVGMGEEQWNMVLSRLAAAKVLTVHRDGAGTLLSLDAHPLLREYFAQKLRTDHPSAWCAGHGRLYQHLWATTRDTPEPSLDKLQPLYQAVAHGCQAGMQRDACARVYSDRIQRGYERYSTFKLGAVGADLGAVACFFDRPWKRLSPSLMEPDQAWLLSEAAFLLLALGRLTEALEPMRAALEMRVAQEDWENVARGTSNLSELRLTLGEVAGAVDDANQSVAHSDRSGHAFLRRVSRTALADGLHQAGHRTEAEARFHEAETMQAESQRQYPFLYSLAGFRYCDFLLAATERAAWTRSPEFAPAQVPSGESAPEHLAHGNGAEAGLESCRTVAERAKQTLAWAERNNVSLLDIALNYLTLGRVALYASILDPANSQLQTASSRITSAVNGIRRAGRQDYLPRGLLTRAWLRFLAGACTGPESAQADLDEAWEIAERGPMPLFLADIHLYRARLFHSVTPYPWDANGQSRGPKDDLAAARQLIDKHGYGRRKEELEDAEQAANHW